MPTRKRMTVEIHKALLPRELKTLALLKRAGNGITLAELSRKTGYPEASASCSLRTLRRPCYGGYSVTKKPLARKSDGLRGLVYLYKLERN